MSRHWQRWRQMPPQTSEFPTTPDMRKKHLRMSALCLLELCATHKNPQNKKLFILQSKQLLYFVCRVINVLPKNEEDKQ